MTTGFASITTVTQRVQLVVLGFRHACSVPRCTTVSPGFLRCVSLPSSSISTSSPWTTHLQYMLKHRTMLLLTEDIEVYRGCSMLRRRSAESWKDQWSFCTMGTRRPGAMSVKRWFVPFSCAMPKPGPLTSRSAPSTLSSDPCEHTAIQIQKRRSSYFTLLSLVGTVSHNHIEPASAP